MHEDMPEPSRRSFLTGVSAIAAAVGLSALPTDALAHHTKKRARNLRPRRVRFKGYRPGTIVVDARKRHLYLVETRSRARRYIVGVGRAGMEFSGVTRIGYKRKWPKWTPTREMQQRNPKKYGRWKDGMPGGPKNPLGARALYLFQGKRDTLYRIHGTNQPWSIGRAASSGCVRMLNDHVADLYERARVGAKVIVL